MSNSSPRAFILPLTVLGGLVVCASPVRSAPLSFHQFLKHQESRTLSLPPLSAPPPAHVPHFTNAGLIQFVVHHEHSPILRDPTIDVQLYHAIAEVRDKNPALFDRLHPQYGRLLANYNLFQYLLGR